MKLKNFEEFSQNKENETVNEARVNVDLYGDLEGFTAIEKRIKSVSDSFSFVPCDPITVVTVDAEFDSFSAYFKIELSNGDEIEFTHDGDGDRVRKEEIIFITKGGRNKIKNPDNIANEVSSSDAPVHVALEYYKKLLKS